MTTPELQRLLRQGEGETVEFKRSLGELREIVETVGAFANAHGGRILIGIDRDGHVVGVDLGRGSLESLANAIQQNTDPKVLPSLSTATVEGKAIIVVEVTESPLKPVFAYHKPFKRVGRSNHVLSAAEVARLAMESYRLSWDAAPLEAELGEIDPEAVKRFLRTARQERNFEVELEIPLEEALEKLHLLHDGRLTRAALLLFGRDPQKHFPQAEIRCARFRGTEPLEFVDM
jgi:ATP-dependent DNA helicase RecG